MVRDDRPSCRLYLMADAGLAPEALVEALEAGDVACVLLRPGDADEDRLRAAIQALRPLAQEREVAFLIQERPEMAAATGCDGVHLSGNGATLKQARNKLGADRIVGASCGDSRHAGMVAGQAGADYVAFGAGPASETAQDAPDPELLSWWQSVMAIPCVAMGGVGLDNAGRLAEAGADFVAIGRAVWLHPAGPAVAVRAVAAAIGGSSG